MKDVKIPKALFLKTQIDQSNRNIGLDIVRAICIICFLIVHTNNYAGLYFDVYKITTPLSYIMQELFFCLSGFLVGNQILKYVNNQNSFEGLLFFYKNRWIRTVPFYFIFLFINYILFHYIYVYSDLPFFKHTSFSVVKYLSFTQNLSSVHPYFFPEVWPLAIEEWSFFIIPIPIYIIVRLTKTNMSYRNMLMFISTCIAIATFYRVYYVLHSNPEIDWELRKIVTYRLDALLYGFLIRLIIDRYKYFFMTYKNQLFLLGSLICFVFFFSKILFSVVLYKLLFFTVIPFFISLTLPYFYFSNFNFISLKIKALFTHISLVSYSMLLSHLYFIQFSLLCIYFPNNAVESILFTVFYFVIVACFSTSFFNYVERPILIRRN